jgi:peptidyl-prolyl cis-trans isomerase A (cyclophilin A)
MSLRSPRSFIVSAPLLLALAACGGGGDDSTGRTPPVAPTQACSSAGVTASNASALGTVCVLTSQGEFVAELFNAQAPQTVANFLQYVQDGSYANSLVHRVAKNFVAQGGGYRWDGSAIATRAPIALENNNTLSNLRGTLGMARTTDPNSATSQFYVNVVDNSACLDRGRTTCDPSGNGYAVFGRVISGMDTVDKMNALTVDTFERPSPEVVVYWVKRLK